MTAECELVPAVGCGKFDHSAFEGTELVSGATDLSLGDGNIWVFCDPEDPDFGKSMGPSWPVLFAGEFRAGRSR